MTYFLITFLAMIMISSNAYLFVPTNLRRVVRPHIEDSKCWSSIFGKKKDLFSDDLFDDDDDTGLNDKVSITNEVDSSSKKKYLDEKWKLNSEDAKEFQGFPSGQKSIQSAVKVPSLRVPVFALMYKFRPEYLEAGTESVVADHKGYVLKFNKILNTEVIDLGKAKGVVVLWAGKTESDGEETRAEILRFLEDDPLVVKDVVENWDIIDLTPKPKSTLPPEVASV